MNEQNALIKTMESLKKVRLPKEVGAAQKALAVVEKNNVVTIEDYELFGKRLAAAKSCRQVIEDLDRDVSIPLYNIWKAAKAEFAKPLKTWDRVISVINQKLTWFETEQARQAAEREAKIREIQAEEAKRIEETAKKKALEAEKSGDLELAKEIRENVLLPIPVVVMPSVPPKIEGIRRSETWIAVVEDIDKLPDQFVTREPKMAVLHALARENEGRNPPPGVRFEKQVTRGKVG